MTLRLITIVGARPQFVKTAAVSRAIATSSGISETLVHTGQHYDANMSDVFFDELGIPRPGHHLGIGSKAHGRQTGEMLGAIEDILRADRPDAVLVYGDTNSTLAGALAAAKLHIPVIHSEAGLRSYNRRMPEELNRVLTDHMSTLLLCPTQASVANLAKEGVTSGVFHVGDVMFDATLFARERALLGHNAQKKLGLEGKRYALCTIHRAENTDDKQRFEQVLDFVDRYSRDFVIVLPAHPRTRPILDKRRDQLKNWLITDPLGYIDLHAVLAGAELVLTDSGGLQKEAYFHRKPCVTLRDETEWVETIEAGWNRLWTQPVFKTPRRDIVDYGRGDAAQLTIAAVERFFR